MNLKGTFSVLILFVALASMAGTDSPKKNKVYNPKANAKIQLEVATKDAKANNKHVLVVVGGNWCSWCMRLDKLFVENQLIAEVIEKNYALVHINYSEENRNLDVLAQLGFPQRFGFPVVVILDGDGKRLHTQNSGYLEKGKGHDPDVVLGFLKDWTPSALEPSRYE